MMASSFEVLAVDADFESEPMVWVNGSSERGSPLAGSKRFFSASKPEIPRPTESPR